MRLLSFLSVLCITSPVWAIVTPADYSSYPRGSSGEAVALLLAAFVIFNLYMLCQKISNGIQTRKAEKAAGITERGYDSLRSAEHSAQQAFGIMASVRPDGCYSDSPELWGFGTEESQALAEKLDWHNDRFNASKAMTKHLLLEAVDSLYMAEQEATKAEPITKLNEKITQTLLADKPLKERLRLVAQSVSSVCNEYERTWNHAYTWN